MDEGEEVERSRACAAEAKRGQQLADGETKENADGPGAEPIDVDGCFMTLLSPIQAHRHARGHLGATEVVPNWWAETRCLGIRWLLAMRQMFALDT